MHSPQGWWQVWVSRSSPDYFPLTSDSFWLEWRLWGMNAGGYHATNVLLHAIAAVLIWRVLLRLRVPAAWGAAMLFAVHPVNVASVAWISERKNTLSLCFYAWSLLAFLKFEDRPRNHAIDESKTDSAQPAGARRMWYAISWVTFIFALLSKTSVVILPVVLVGIIIWLRRKISGRDIVNVLPFFLAAIALGLLTIHYQYRNVISGASVRPEGFASRFAAAGWAVGFYLFKAIVPIDLMMIYPRWSVDPHQFISYLPDLFLAILAGTICLRRRTWRTPLLAAGAYYLIALLPVLGVFDMYYFRFSLVADHWQYIAIIAPITLCISSIWTSLSARVSPEVLKIALAFVIVTFAGLTFRQASQYQSSETLFADNIRRNPHSWAARKALADVFYERGNYFAAASLYRDTLADNPDFSDAWLNYGNVLEDMGMIDDAIQAERHALDLSPDDARPWNTLGQCFAANHELNSAIEAFEHATKINPRYTAAFNNWGVVLSRDAHRDEEAIVLYRKALMIEPDFTAAQYNLGNLLFRLGRLNEIIDPYTGYLAENPEDAEVHRRLGIALAQAGKTEQAKAELKRALSLNPTLPLARDELQKLQ